MPFFSIQLNSNRPAPLVRFFDNIEATADRPEDIEVLLHIDAGDRRMEALAAYETPRRRFTLRVLQTDLVQGYATLWKPLNPLFRMTHPDAYFVANLFDEARFETKGWDSVIRRYAGYYPDHIFRLRCSRYRFRNYTDFWECGYAPDSLAFYTRRWLELSGDWNPCLGPDSFQQCVAFYLFTGGRERSGRHYCRDIPVPELRFTGEGAGLGLEGEARYRRLAINTRAWFVLMSHGMQQEASRRAMRMKAHMMAYENGGEESVAVEEESRRRLFTLKSRVSLAVLAVLPYRLSWRATTLLSWRRAPSMLYYAGGGMAGWKHAVASLFLVGASHIPYGEKLLHKVGVFIKSRKKEAAPAARTDAFLPGFGAAGDSGFDDGAAFISIGVASDNPEKVAAFVDSIERTAICPEKIEVVVHTQNTLVRRNLDAQIPPRRIKLRDAADGAPGGNHNKAAYFTAFLSDGIRFETPGWDSELKQYTGYYPDHLFRLRCSRQRFRNYATLDECVSAPDSITFYTRKWLAVQEGQGVTSGHDAFQQCVSFYLFTGNPFCHTQYYRDIALPHLRFSGEAEYTGHDIVPQGIRSAARECAMRLKAAILAEGERLPSPL